MLDNRVQRLHAQHGQAAVESALVMPMTLFVILGVIQLSMLQQARMLADYAAYKGARAASVGQADCKVITPAEIAALVPTLGRADTATRWVTTFETNKGNQRGGLPIVYTEYKISDQHKPFDMTLKADEKPEKVHLRLHYFYEMHIPFANWLFAQYYLAQRGLESWAGMADPINPVAKTEVPPSVASAFVDSAYVKTYFDNRHYVIPLQASWSFRMFSQASNLTGSCK